MIRILIADDENLIRVALAQLLDLEDDLDEARQELEQLREGGAAEG